MSTRAYITAPENEKDHFVQCPACGEWLDKRDLDEVLTHIHGRPQPDAAYTGARGIRRAERLGS